MNRRQFLGAGACVVGSIALGRSIARASAPAALQGAPRLDSHVHIVSPRLHEAIERAVGRGPFQPLGAQQLVERLDREGIAQAWILSEAYLAAAEVWDVTDDSEELALVRAENDFVAAQAARFPQRLVPFLSVNPKRDYALDEIDRCAELGLRGLKLHCWNSLVDVRDGEQRSMLRAVLERAAAHGLPVVAHAFNGSVKGYGEQDVELWARELVLPIEKLRICFAHLGGAGGFAEPVQTVLAALVEHLGPSSPAARRVTVDLSAVLMSENALGFPPTRPAERSRMGELLEAWGCDRVLWGSDSIPDYLALCRPVWPLGDEEWTTLCRQRGDAFRFRN